MGKRQRFYFGDQYLSEGDLNYFENDRWKLSKSKFVEIVSRQSGKALIGRTVTERNYKAKNLRIMFYKQLK